MSNALRRGTTRAATALLLAVALAGCNTAGTQAVRKARVDYNEALTAAYNEQMLLNLVRLRYRDTPHFLEVSGLVTEHVLGASAAASATLGGGDADVGVSLGGSYEEQPTVLYSPLAGEAFVTRLLTPIQIETLYLLMRSGWSIERVMRCCVRQMNDLLNAPSADGPTPSYTPEFEEFVAVSRVLRDLQVRHLLQLDAAQRGVWDAVGAAAGTAPDGRDGDGGRNGDGDRDDDGDGGLEFFLVFEEGAGAASRDAVEQARRQLFDAMGLEPARRGGVGVLPLRAGILRTPDPEAALRLRPRSLMGVFYLLSQGVEVPAEHLEQGLATVTEPGDAIPVAWSGGCPPTPWSAGLDWPRTVLAEMFAVRTSRQRPEGAFVRIRYRGHWFYIPDCDLQSKSTFALLVQLFALQSGDPKERASAVVLSLGD